MSEAAAQKRIDGAAGHSVSESTTPKSGATEKQAPVRAVPRLRKPTTKSVSARP